MNDTYKWQDHGHTYWPESFKFKWPSGDTRLAGDIHSLTDLDSAVFPLIKNKRIAVQAGGAMGMWAKRMAQEFEIVYTFEPTPQSFHCLVSNCPEENIVKMQAALGEKPGLIKMGDPERATNYGAFYCQKGGYIPTIRIDDLGLDGCDLLMLDIEGYELFALKGARETIAKYRPVIVLEDKGCSSRFGINRGALQHYLTEKHKYSKFNRFHKEKDLACIP